MLTQGDCLDVLGGMAADSAALVYADPPFNSGRDYAEAKGKFGDRFASMSEYIDWICPRVKQMWRVTGGSLYLHCDDTAVHHLRVMLDGICGDRAFRSHIVWKRAFAHNQASSSFARVCDHIVCYAKSGATYNKMHVPYDKDYIDKYYKFDDGDGRGRYWKECIRAPQDNPKSKFRFRGYAPPEKGWCMSKAKMEALAKDGRLCFPTYSDGSPAYDRRITRKSYLSEKKGLAITNLWTDITQLLAVHSERINYPTQKPIALLERVIAASSDKGDLVVDPFMGSGTTLVAAKRLGRDFAGCDISADAVAVAQSRLEEVLL